MRERKSRSERSKTSRPSKPGPKQPRGPKRATPASGMKQPSHGSQQAEAALPPSGTRKAEPPPDRRTLDQELGSPDFAIRGFYRLVDLADYLSHFADGRAVGLYSIEDRKVFERVVGLASVVKAAAQWFPFDDGPKPKFVAYAEKYLAEGPHDVPMIVPLVVKGLHWNLRTGPVVRVKGGQGARGRLHSLAALKRNLITLIEPLTEEDLRIHLLAYRNPQNPRPKQSWLLPPAIADQIFSAFVNGTLADLLHEQDFRWNWEEQRPAICSALARYFNEEVRLGRELSDRSSHLEKLAERLIIVALESLRIRVPKDFFRDRRGRPERTEK